MFSAILTAFFRLIVLKTKLKISNIEFELVNLLKLTFVSAPLGSGKSAALQAGVNGPILAVKENCDAPIVIEDITKNGLFLHLKDMGG